MTDETQSDPSLKLLLWLFPATYLVHIAEEYWGGEGYSSYLARMRGANLPPTKFLIMNGVALALMVAGIFVSRRFKFPQLLLVCLGTVVLVNGLSHTINGLVTTAYNPGLISGMLVWIPLGTLSLLRVKGTMRTRRYLTGMAIGVSVHAVVTLLALTSGRHLIS